MNNIPTILLVSPFVFLLLSPFWIQAQAFGWILIAASPVLLLVIGVFNFIALVQIILLIRDRGISRTLKRFWFTILLIVIWSFVLGAAALAFIDCSSCFLNLYDKFFDML